MRKVLLALMIMVFILFSSCNERHDEKMLSVAVAQEPPTLDVMVNTSLSGRNIVVGNVYERVLVIDENGNIVPFLAEDFELLDQGCTLRMTIRDGITFHDGTQLEADDVASSLNRWLYVYSNARKMVGESRFETDGCDVVIHSDSSIALLPVMLASSPQAAVIVPSSSLSSLTSNGLLIEAPGTGPYKIKDWVSGAYIELDEYKEYWGVKPIINNIRYNFVSDPVTRRLGLESGQYDFIDTVSSDDIQALEKSDSIALHQGGETGSIVLVFNKKAGISMDQNFRKAVSLFINREELMRACYGDSGYYLHSDYMDSGDALWSVDPALDSYGAEDDDSGRSFLSASSYSGEKVRILSSNLSNIDKIAITLSSELEKEGIETELIILDWASFMEKRNDPFSWDIYVSATSKVVLPIEKGYLFSSSPGGFDDKRSSELIERMSSSSTIEEASVLWKETQKALWEYVPVIVPGHYSTVYASSAALHDIDFSDGYNFRNAYLD